MITVKMVWTRIEKLRGCTIHRKHNGDTLPCKKCDGHLEAGDSCYSHQAKGETVYYHVDCYRKLWI